MKLVRRVVLALTTAALAGLTVSAAAQTHWDLPSAYPSTNLHTQNLAQFVKDVAADTSGKLQIQLHDNASLYKAPEIKRAVQGGQAQSGEILMVNYQNEWPLWGLDGIPFLATSYAEAWKLYQASKPAIVKKLASQGMMLLYTVPWPPQGIFSKKKIESAADLKGVKWRAYSPATARIAELVGAQPVTVQQAELSQAMATGMVQAYMASGSTGLDTKTQDYLKFFANTQAWLPKNAVITNKEAFDALDPATQAGLLKAAAAAEKRGWALSEKKAGEYLVTLRQVGTTVYAPSAQLSADMRKVGDTLLADWMKKAGSEGKAVIAAYRTGK